MSTTRRADPLLGLVRHLAEMERDTFLVTMTGHDVPRLFCSDSNRDGDFEGAVPDPEVVVADAWDAWRGEGLPLNQHGSGGEQTSRREALVGMLEEYARHMGHADLLRERIDGRLGQ